MDLSAFSTNYAHLDDNELLCLWADRNNLVPEANAALESELQRRGLKKENADRVKKRLDLLAARDAKGPLVKQVEKAKYERNLRHFVGWEEPEFYSPYHGRDIRSTFAYFRHQYRVWSAFRAHTGHWPLYSIWFHFLSWIAVFGLFVAAFFWAGEREGRWGFLALIVGAVAVIGVRDLAAKQMRKLDWKRFGTEKQ